MLCGFQCKSPYRVASSALAPSPILLLVVVYYFMRDQCQGLGAKHHLKPMARGLYSAYALF